MSKLNTFVIPIIRKDFLGRCLETLYKYTEPNFNVFVIDQTGDLETEEKYRHLTHMWIRPYENLGFAKAVNTGFTLSQTEYITALNDDVEFMNKRWWQGIIDTFDMDKNIVAVNPNSPKEGAWGYGLTSDNKDTWKPKEGFEFDGEKSVLPVINGKTFEHKENFTDEDYDSLLNNHPIWAKDTLCDALAMWCTVFKKETLQPIGLLDERFYPGGGEDYDMMARIYSCAWPTPRETCDPSFHRRAVGTTKSWVWHHWGKSKDDFSAKDPTNIMFPRKRWNDNDELWWDGFDVWGHKDVDGKKIPLKRVPEIHVDNL